MTEFLNTLLQRLAYLASSFISSLISGFFAASQWVATLCINVFVGVMAQLMAQMPGVTDEAAFNTANQIRIYLEQWNSLFPVYEGIVCINAIVGFRIAVGAYRAIITLIWNSSNLHNCFPKFFGTG